MIFTILIVLMLLTSVILVAAILLQAGKGGGLAANFGGAGSSSDAFLGSRQASNLLTKTSWGAGGAFLFLAFLLSLISSRPSGPTSILEREFQNTPQGQLPPTGGAGSASPTVPPPLPLDLKSGGDTGTGKAVPPPTSPSGG